MAVLCDQDGVFPLSAWIVGRDHSEVIFPNVELSCFHLYNWLNRENISWLHQIRVVVAVMIHNRRHMHILADTMPCEELI